MLTRVFSLAPVEDGEGTWEPVGDGRAVGFRHVSSRGVTYIYLNPSTETDDDPNVFLYKGEHGDPAHDTPLCHITVK